ncbi:MAG: site-specific integrase [Armatimonadota bacterium]
MGAEIVRSEEAATALASLAGQARDYIGQAKAENTLRAYRADWRDFTAWCERAELSALPAAPQTVALYLTDRAETCKVSTLQRRLSAISQVHEVAGYGSPTKSSPVRLVWQGIRRAKGVAQQGKAPAVTADIRSMVAALPAGALGVRDRAILLVGFAGAFRRSELVGLDRGDVELTRPGVTVTLRRSKTDQEGQGRKLGIPYGSRPDTCPVRALLEWLEVSAIVEGPLFRPLNRHGGILEGRLSDKAIARVVKRAAEAAGLDPTRYSGHSLRAGLATSAATAGVSERAIMQQTGHRSVGMVRRYIREGCLFRENAAASVGL